MWNLVGIARTAERLLMAKARIEIIMDEVNRYYWNYFVTKVRSMTLLYLLYPAQRALGTHWYIAGEGTNGLHPLNSPIDCNTFASSAPLQLKWWAAGQGQRHICKPAAARWWLNP